ncbi:MAG: metallophosphoesterase [Bacteroidales bacterium]|nr:MAG: metallophosphoesterase [Bacteroidales bacterium]
MNPILIQIVLSLHISLALNATMEDQTCKDPGTLPDTALLSFGVISDIQYCDCETMGTRHYRNSLHKLKQCLEELNRQELSFIIDLGDKIESGLASYDSIIKIYNTLDIPLFHVMGNHDYLVEDEEKSQINELLKIENTYYDFKLESWRFIILDGNEISLVANPENSPGYRRARQIYDQLKSQQAINAVEWNGAIAREQIIWLKDRLKYAKEHGEKVIIFCHYPVYPEMVYNLWNNTRLLSIIGRSDNVIAYISGHNHEGDYGLSRSKHYITFKGLVETPDEISYAIVHLFSDRIEIEGGGRESDHILYY